MNWLDPVFILAAAWLAVFVESSTTISHRLLGAQFDLLPAVMVYASFTHGLGMMVALAVCGGLWFDSLSANPLGISVLPLFVLGVSLHAKRDLLLRDQLTTQVVAGTVASVLCPVLTLFMLLNEGATPMLGWRTAWALVVMGAAGGLATPLLFGLFARLQRAFNYQPVIQSSFRPDRVIERGRT